MVSYDGQFPLLLNTLLCQLFAEKKGHPVNFGLKINMIMIVGLSVLSENDNLKSEKDHLNMIIVWL